MHRSLVGALALWLAACSGPSRPTKPGVAQCDAEDDLASITAFTSDGYLYRAFDAATRVHERCATDATRDALANTRDDLFGTGEAATTLEPKQRDRALALYRDGANLRLQGEYDLALTQLERSLAIWPHPLTMVQIGLTHEATGTLVDARKAYARALAAAETIAGEPPAPRVIRGHASSIDALSYSSDNRTIASSAHRQVKLWDTVTGKQTGSFTVEGRGSVHGLSFTSRPDVLAIGRSKHDENPAALELWKLPGGEVISRFPADGDRVASLVSAGEHVAYAIDHDVYVRTLDGDLAFTRSMPDEVRRVALSSDGRRLAYGDAQGRVAIRSLDDDSETTTKTRNDRTLQALEFAADGDQLVIATTDGFSLWDITTATSIGYVETGIHSLISSSTDRGTHLLATGHGNGVHLFGLPAMVEALFIGSSNVRRVELSPDGTRIAVASGTSLLIHDTATGELIHTVGSAEQPQSAAFSTNMFTVSGVKLFSVWDASKHPPVVSYLMPTNTTAAFGPDPERFLFGMVDISIVNATTHEVERSLDDSSASVLSLTYSHDGTLAAAGDANGIVRIWTIADGALVTEMQTGAGWVWDVEISPDNRHVATAGTVSVIFDLATGEVVERINDAYAAIEYSPDGELIQHRSALAISHDGTMTARGLLGGDVELDDESLPTSRTLSGHDGQVQHIDFSRDDRYLLTIGADATVRLWSSSTASHLATLVADAPDTWLVIANDHRVDGSEAGKDLLYWEAGSIRLPGFVGWQRHHAPELLGSVMPVSK
jgi:WD40 repeat protein